ncbi:hypothetical protein ACS0ZG_27805 [Burkholderia gladioli]|uniref:hypothetical protein n=1 Tax=Burkholderia gladioli TaxID=28095 RepID=UPI003F7B1084
MKLGEKCSPVIFMSEKAKLVLRQVLEARAKRRAIAAFVDHLPKHVTLCSDTRWMIRIG